MDLKLESMIKRLRVEGRTDRMSTAEVVRYTDLVVSAARTLAVRRIEREPLSSHMGVTLARAFGEANDPGLNAINMSLRQISDKAGLCVHDWRSHPQGWGCARCGDVEQGLHPMGALAAGVATETER